MRLGLLAVLCLSFLNPAVLSKTNVSVEEHPQKGRVFVFKKESSNDGDEKENQQKQSTVPKVNQDYFLDLDFVGELKLDVFVNNYWIARADAKTYNKINIKRYLTKGKNKIVLLPVAPKNKNERSKQASSKMFFVSRKSSKSKSVIAFNIIDKPNQLKPGQEPKSKWIHDIIAS